MQGSFAVNLLQRRAEAIWTCWLTYDLHFVCGVDLPRSVGHMARVLPALLRRQVLQTQRPPLLPAFLSSRSFLLIQQRPVVLQPHDVGPRVAAGRALQPHRAAHRAGDDSLSHFWRLSETWTHWNGGQRERNCWDQELFQQNVLRKVEVFSATNWKTLPLTHHGRTALSYE